jgi:diacylglycerol kinase family enzyme
MQVIGSEHRNLTVCVILNNRAGLFPRARKDEVKRSFERYPEVTCTFRELTETGLPDETAREPVSARPDIVAAGGGDGTINTVVNMLAGTDTILGVLPLGTRNHFAKDLGIPDDVDGAVDIICRGSTAQVDVGRVNDTLFVNNVSLGMYPKAVRLRDRWRSYIGKWPAMFLAMAVVFLRLPWFTVRLHYQGKVVRRFVPMLFVGNNRYETRWHEVGTRATLDRGILWLMLLKKKGPGQALHSAWLALRDRTYEADAVEVAEISELAVRSTRKRLSIGIDGERMKQRTPLLFSSGKGLLKVRVPKAPVEKDETRPTGPNDPCSTD